MHKINVAIIDDEADARFLLRKALEKHLGDHLATITEADGVRSGLALLRAENIQLVFLDIQMQDGTGFCLLEQCPQIDFTIIFVTAYSNFALRAFDFFAFAYLVKPFKAAELTYVTQRFLQDRTPSLVPAVRILSESMDQGRIDRIVLAERGGFRILDLADVLYLKSDGSYTEFFLTDGTRQLCSKPIKVYDQTLVQEGFFRIHRSYLINLRHVTQYSNQDSTVIIKNGHALPLGRRRVATFREQFWG